LKRILSLLALALSALPAPAAEPAMPAACVTVYAPPHWAGCGTCVASEGGKSLVVTNNHIWSERNHPAGGFYDDIYPVRGQVSAGVGLSAPRFAAVAVAGDRERDLVLVVVDGELPVAELAEENAPAGTKVWRFGHGTGAQSAEVLAPRPELASVPRCQFRATGRSESGDSGSGYFSAAGELVAVHVGADPKPRGTPVAHVRAFLAAHAGKHFPKLHARLHGPKEMPDPKKPAAKGACPCEDCPCGKGGKCSCGAYCSCKDCPAHKKPAKAGCICGDDCKCKPGECPAKCPVARPVAKPVPLAAPACPSCAGGRCEVPASPSRRLLFRRW
jgi:hypothetical protein